MKGISPIIASVLLIAITMSIAVILAAYVTQYTQETTGSIPTACIGGALFVHGTPTCETTTDVLTITLEANYVSLADFKLDSRDSAGNIEDSSITMSPTAGLAPGEIGTYTANVAECDNIDEVRVTTDCFNVRSGWTSV